MHQKTENLKTKEHCTGAAGQGSASDVKSMTLEELTAAMKEKGYPAFRAKQLYRWMHVSLAREYDEMTNIPKAMAAQLR